MRLIPVTLLSLQELCRDARPDEIAQYEAMTGRMWSPDDVAVDYYTRGGEAYTLIDDDGRAIAAAGWEPVIEGVWRAWMVGTLANWATHWRSITKTIRRVMDTMLDGGERRLEIMCLQSRCAARAWYVKGLRMRHEGDLAGFGMNGEYCSMYARVRDPNGQF